jgi:hypothetical protein
MRCARAVAPPPGGPTRHRGLYALAGARVGGDRPASGAGQNVQEDLMATTIHEAGRRIALDEIRVPENMRALDDSHVQDRHA